MLRLKIEDPLKYHFYIKRYLENYGTKEGNPSNEEIGQTLEWQGIRQSHMQETHAVLRQTLRKAIS